MGNRKEGKKGSASQRGSKCRPAKRRGKKEGMTILPQRNGGGGPPSDLSRGGRRGKGHGSRGIEGKVEKRGVLKSLIPAEKKGAGRLSKKQWSSAERKGKGRVICLLALGCELWGGRGERGKLAWSRQGEGGKREGGSLGERTYVKERFGGRCLIEKCGEGLHTPRESGEKGGAT